ncbi:putative transposon Ty3-I Gag-Pol polyprotein [Operophtera brumata]|uniref:Putative transposon Ty3-I Gag-Pol polyprotein n=1 Tax=Operophtera brumata TaxID=104452 RepID=A0A0L7LI73_OPEBR|nr:putative transposon Ty3-I Gag-Pol polyprotein [Operophtera brumata]
MSAFRSGLWSKNVNWVAEQLRRKEIRVIVYLDDFLLASQSHHLLLLHIQDTLNLLRNLGWSVNHEKSVVIPCKGLEYLGVDWDLHQNLKGISRKKLKKVSQQVASISYVSLSRWAGYIVGLFKFTATEIFERIPSR